MRLNFLSVHGAPSHTTYDVGNHSPVNLEEFIDTIARVIGKPAIKVYRPMRPGDVVATFADIARLRDWIGFAPSTPLELGIERFVAWFRRHHTDADGALASIPQQF